MKVLVERAFAFSRLVSYAVWKLVPMTTVPAALSILAFSRASLQGHSKAHPNEIWRSEVKRRFQRTMALRTCELCVYTAGHCSFVDEAICLEY